MEEFADLVVVDCREVGVPEPDGPEVVDGVWADNVGGSHRWAAGAIMLLGAFTCGLGSPGKDAATKVLAVLGIAAGVLAVLAIVTGSLTPLSLLTVDIVLLWAASTVRHAHQPIHA